MKRLSMMCTSAALLVVAGCGDAMMPNMSEPKQKEQEVKILEREMEVLAFG